MLAYGKLLGPQQGTLEVRLASRILEVRGEPWHTAAYFSNWGHWALTSYGRVNFCCNALDVAGCGVVAELRVLVNLFGAQYPHVAFDVQPATSEFLKSWQTGGTNMPSWYDAKTSRRQDRTPTLVRVQQVMQDVQELEFGPSPSLRSKVNEFLQFASRVGNKQINNREAAQLASRLAQK